VKHGLEDYLLEMEAIRQGGRNSNEVSPAKAQLQSRKTFIGKALISAEQNTIVIKTKVSF